VARIGVLSLYLPGHVHPALALSAHLKARGHRVCFISTADTQHSCARAGVRLVSFGAQFAPPGTLAQLQRELGVLHDEQAFRFFVEHTLALAECAFAELPTLLVRESLDLLLVDQLFPGGSTLAQHAGVCVVTLALALLFYPDAHGPPPIFAWPLTGGPEAQARNLEGWDHLAQLVAPWRARINTQRIAWSLPPYSDLLRESLSPRLTLAQQPPSLERPHTGLPSSVHLLGPWRRSEVLPPAPLPVLSGRPLVYASFGTLQNGLEWIFRAVLEAVRPLDLDMVVSLGGGSLVGSAVLGDPPPQVTLVPYAPQHELLARAQLAITHAGLNTVSDCLLAGVPMVAIPLASEQPGIAARVVGSGTGVMVALADLSAQRLRAAIQEVLTEPTYRTRAREHAAELSRLRPLEDAADLIHALLKEEQRQ
jgi:zeaxanthin glucosyltransferase